MTSSPQHTPFAVRDFLRERKDSFYRRLRSRGLDAAGDVSALAGSASLLSEQSGALALSYAHEAPEPDVDTASMTATFTITTPRRDRYGDVVVPRGCLKTLDDYRKNPVVFFGHKSSELPVALCLTAGGGFGLEVGEDSIRATARFHGDTSDSVCVFGLVAKRILRATSIGFLPVRAAVIGSDKSEEELDEEWRKRRKERTDEGEKVVDFDPWFPLRFLEWSLLEWSVVSVPANPDCCDSLSTCLDKGQVDGEKISPSLRKSLEPFSLKARVWCHGFDPSREKYSGVLRMGESELEYSEGKLRRVDSVSLEPSPSPAVDPPAPLSPAVTLPQDKGRKDASLCDPHTSTVTQPASGPSGENPMTPEEHKKSLEGLHAKADALARTMAEHHEAMTLQYKDLSGRHDALMQCHKDLFAKCEAIHGSVKDLVATPVPDPPAARAAADDAALLARLSLLVGEFAEKHQETYKQFFALTGKRV